MTGRFGCSTYRPQRALTMLFIDGLGIGSENPRENPMARFNPRILCIFESTAGPVMAEGRVLPTDVRMGVAGTPQSATNQTTLFTGTNAAQRLGRHVSGFPNGSLKELIRQRSLMRRLHRQGCQVTFANAYRPAFFSNRPRWVSVTTVMCETAGVRLRTFHDLEQDRALYMDYTNRLLREQGLDLPLRSPGEAARILVNLAAEYEFCLYEYFLTDLVGHRGDLEQATEILVHLDEFLSVLVEETLPGRSLLVTSDHGNIEAMSHKGHTQNQVATFFWGEICEQVRDRDSISLVEISSVIENYLTAHQQ